MGVVFGLIDIGALCSSRSSSPYGSYNQFNGVTLRTDPQLLAMVRSSVVELVQRVAPKRRVASWRRVVRSYSRRCSATEFVTVAPRRTTISQVARRGATVISLRDS